MTGRRLKILQIVPRLDIAGAEVALVRLLSTLDPQAFDVEVLTLTEGGSLQSDIEELGIPVTTIPFKRAPTALVRLLSLRAEIGRRSPDVVHTWMYYADVVAGVAARAAGVRNVAWNVRNSDLMPGAYRRSAHAAAWLAARLAGIVPNMIVCNSEASRMFHVARGYPTSRMRVILNGFEVLEPDPSARQCVRRELGLLRDTPLVGRFGRFHPHKDYGTFIKAASIVAERRRDVHFVLAGEDVVPDNPQLARLIGATCSPERFHLLGLRRDLDRIHLALDVACSSSRGESFPNVVAEAMAAGVPVVATDVGASAEIVDGAGVVVPALDFTAMAEGIGRLLSMTASERAKLGDAARERIRSQFGLHATAVAYARLYREMANVRD